MEWSGGLGGRGMERWLHREDGEFLEWDTRRYATVPEEVIQGLVWDFLHKARTEVVNKKTGSVGVEPFHPTSAKVSNVLEAIGSVVQLRDRLGEGWPRWREEVREGAPPPTELIAFRNGLLDVETGRMAAHTPMLLNRVALPYDWLGEGVENGGCERWLKFVGEILPGDQQSIDILQEMMGLLMTGDTRFQKGLMLVGPPRSGRGTIGRVLKGLLGADNIVAPTLSTLGTHFGLEGLIGKRLALIGDMLLGRGTDGEAAKERILGITGEDTISIPRKGRGDWTGKLGVRFLALANKLPRLDDSSGAIMSRFVILLLTQSFLGREDKDLEKKLLPELPAIAAWSLQGLKRLRDRGRFEVAETAAELAQEFRDLGDPIGQWLREECEVDPTGEKGWSEECTLTHNRWAAWCVQQKWTKQWTQSMFRRELRAALPWITTIRPRKTGECDSAGAEVSGGTATTTTTVARPREYFGLRRKGGEGAAPSATTEQTGGQEAAATPEGAATNTDELQTGIMSGTVIGNGVWPPQRPVFGPPTGTV
jgi:putative DNA primase/helicase